MESSQINLPKKNIAGKIIVYVISCAAAIVLILILICVFMTRSQSEVPVMMGYSMFSISTEGGFVPSGDMALCKIKSGSKIAAGDKVVFKDGYDEFNNAIIKTGSIEMVETTNGESFFTILSEDTQRPTVDIIGEISFAVPKLGMIVDFVKTPLGLIYCVAVPLFLLLIYEVVNLVRLSKKQKLEDNEMESTLPSYMRIGEDDEAGEDIALSLAPPNIGKSIPKNPFAVDEARSAQELVSGLNRNFTYEQQDEVLEVVPPRGAFQSVSYKKPEPLKDEAAVAAATATAAGSIYSTREWELPVAPEEKPPKASQEKATPHEPPSEDQNFSATVGSNTKNHFKIEGIDVKVVSDAIKLSLDNDTQSRDISITVTDEYTNVVVETKTAEINFALFKDESDNEQKVIIQKKVKE